jgi:class 3 adenylate cyclase/TolB-like protein
MISTRVDRRLAAILAADVVSYSRLIEKDEASTLAALRSLRHDVIDPLLAEHQGRTVKLMGAGLLAEFGSVVDAVACPVAVQKGVAEHQAEAPPDRRIVFRCGVNLGDVVVEGEDLPGDGVNIAARLEQICEPGGVIISGTAYDHLQGKLRLPIVFAGEQRLKNIDRPIRTYQIRLAGKQLGPRWTLRRVRRRAPGAVILLALGLLGGIAHWLWPRASSLAGKPAVAVLPFDNIAGDAATGRLAADIITDLARFRDLAVIDCNSTTAYKGKPVDVREIGRSLNVGYVLGGSIQRQDDQVRVTAQLLDATTAAHIWSER